MMILALHGCLVRMSCLLTHRPKVSVDICTVVLCTAFLQIVRAADAYVPVCSICGVRREFLWQR